MFSFKSRGKREEGEGRKEKRAHKEKKEEKEKSRKEKKEKAKQRDNEDADAPGETIVPSPSLPNGMGGELKKSKSRTSKKSYSYSSSSAAASSSSSNTGRGLPARLMGVVRNSDGGLKLIDSSVLERQKGVAVDLVKSASKSILEGNGIVTISLPVRIFEPRSILERLAMSWGSGLEQLRRAAASTDPVERLKNVVAFGVSCLHMSCWQLKPFNPILGETLQSRFPDGARVYMEHTRHTPPTSHFHLLGPDGSYEMYGHVALEGQLKGNYGLVKQNGFAKILFQDGGSIRWTFPTCKQSGFMWGSQVFECCGRLKYIDEGNRLHCHLVLAPDPAPLIGRPKTPSDTLRGLIVRAAAPVSAEGVGSTPGVSQGAETVSAPSSSSSSDSRSNAFVPTPQVVSSSKEKQQKPRDDEESKIATETHEEDVLPHSGRRPTNSNWGTLEAASSGEGDAFEIAETLDTGSRSKLPSNVPTESKADTTDWPECESSPRESKEAHPSGGEMHPGQSSSYAPQSLSGVGESSSDAPPKAVCVPDSVEDALQCPKQGGDDIKKEVGVSQKSTEFGSTSVTRHESTQQAICHDVEGGGRELDVAAAAPSVEPASQVDEETTKAVKEKRSKRLTLRKGRELMKLKSKDKDKEKYKKGGGRQTSSQSKASALGEKVSVATGSWLEGVYFDGKCYWDLNDCEFVVPVPPQPEEEVVLPSDSRYRPDSNFLFGGRVEQAQQHKLKLEERQRNDRNARADHMKTM